MNAPAAPREVAVVDRPADLARALAPGFAAAILRRAPPAGLLEALAAWPAERLPQLRGALAPGGAPRPLHRSPPIEGRGETRLLLVIDPGDAERGA